MRHYCQPECADSSGQQLSLALAQVAQAQRAPCEIRDPMVGSLQCKIFRQMFNEPLWNLSAEYFSLYGLSEQFQGPRSDSVPARKGKKKRKKIGLSATDSTWPSPTFPSSSSLPCGRAQNWTKAAEIAQIKDRKRSNQRIQQFFFIHRRCFIEHLAKYFAL